MKILIVSRKTHPRPGLHNIKYLNEIYEKMMHIYTLQKQGKITQSNDQSINQGFPVGITQLLFLKSSTFISSPPIN